MLVDKSRRSFLASVTGAASVGSLAIGPSTIAGRGTVALTQQAAGRGPQRWDTAWLDTFKGRHKQVYDLMWHTLRPGTLNPPTNFLDAHKEVAQLEFPDVNVVIGANSTCFPINASDALWATFKLGERYNIIDPATKQPAIRNVYLGPASGGPAATVRALQARGALFIMCNNALHSMAADWSRDLNRPPSEVHAELVAGLHTGVRVVPALTWAVGMLQERGFTYEKL